MRVVIGDKERNYQGDINKLWASNRVKEGKNAGTAANTNCNCCV